MKATGYLSAQGHTLQTLMVILVTTPTFLAGGYTQPFLGGIFSYPSFYTQFDSINTVTSPAIETTHRALIQGVVNAVVNLGAVIGALTCVYSGNKLGRRMSVAAGALGTIIGTALFVSSFSLGQLILGRLVLGFGVGFMIATAPVWQAEISTTHNRGHHVIVSGIATAGGVAISSWLTFAFGRIDSTSGWIWRVPGVMTGVFGMIILFATYLFPESPRWLALVNRHGDARQVLGRIHKCDPNGAVVSSVLESVVHANEEAAEGASFGAVFRMGKEKMLYRVFLACSVQWYSQMAGSALITYYSKELFAVIGLDKNLSAILASVVLTWKFMCCFISFYTIERAGRRKLFLIAAVGMTVCMFCLAICGSQVSPSNTGSAYAGVVFAFVFVIFYPIGFLGPNYVYSQEVITTRYRAPVSGMSIAVHWLTSFAVSLTTPLGFTAIGWKFYLVWGASAATAIPISYFFYPETTGLSMEDIDQVFIDSGSVLGTRYLAAERVRQAARVKGSSAVEDFELDLKPQDAQIEGTASQAEK